jgi:TP901-1 family phage major tail protein
MATQSGAMMLLKIESGLVFKTIGGLRTTRILLSNQLIDTTHKESGAWRECLGSAGISSLTISGAGVFTDSSSECELRQYAFANIVKRYQIIFGNRDVLSGAFQITSYERLGGYNDEETYSLTLESSGIIKFEAS